MRSLRYKSLAMVEFSPFHNALSVASPIRKRHQQALRRSRRRKKFLASTLAWGCKLYNGLSASCGGLNSSKVEVELELKIFRRSKYNTNEALPRSLSRSSILRESSTDVTVLGPSVDIILHELDLPVFLAALYALDLHEPFL